MIVVIPHYKGRLWKEIVYVEFEDLHRRGMSLHFIPLEGLRDLPYHTMKFGLNNISLAVL